MTWRAVALLLATTVQPLHGQEAAPVAWVDPSPHRSGLVTVNGVRLHYLDWGGKGETLLFLHGLGSSAHVFDDIAPRFTDRCRVLALTIRGHGESEVPETGYETGTLVEDLRQFLDAIKVDRVTLAGHSAADKQMTVFAGTYPERVLKLVYLDAAYDRATLRRMQAEDPLPLPRPSKDDESSFEAYRKWWKSARGFWSNAVEADRRATSLAADGSIKPSVPPRVSQAMMDGALRPPADYAKVRAPALAFYAIYGVPRWMPASADAATRQKVAEYLARVRAPYQRSSMEKFRTGMAKGRIVEVKGSDHWVFVVSEDVVVREMRTFLAER